MQLEDLFERGLDEREVSRLRFVRWSVQAGYAQFGEWITADAPSSRHEIAISREPRAGERRCPRVSSPARG